MSYSSRELAWRKEQVIPLLSELVSQGFSPTAWQAQYRFPEGTCDLYWVFHEVCERKEGQSWFDYQHMCKESLTASFSDWTTNKSIKQEVLLNFENVRKYNEEQRKHIDDYLYFLVYWRSENDTEAGHN